jgi:uncharacterized protein
MTTQIYINLPVKDLTKSKAFFSHLGYTFNQQFTDENAACMIISDNIFSMLLLEPFFKMFTKKDIANAKETTEVLIALSCISREDVNDMVKKAVEAGGTIYSEPMDHGFMYQHSFADLDGHQWELMFMEPNHIVP